MTISKDTMELPAQYDPRAIEREIYARWLAAGAFTADGARVLSGERRPFVIVIPPPNVTDILHTGHGLNNTVQDVLIRWRRMAGDEALWLPGTDHAGIATQNVVERLIAKEGLSRFDLGRDAFVARVTEFVSSTGGTILEQLKAIGSSCDWSRTAYTFSPHLSRAVREAFVRLYERGLVYRGHRVIHWCPRCLTALSDEEAEHADESGSLYHIRYPVPRGSAGAPPYVVVATTRPETMLGDVAVAVHSDDARYRALIGATVTLPIVNIAIPVIGDQYVDPSFGTGVVKVTPAHDANDFEMGQRHGLPMPVVMSPTATMEEETDAAGRVPASLRGLDRFAARERIVEMLQAQGLVEKIERHEHRIRHCYRCNTVVEPRLSDQWFVRMEPLARPALDAVRRGRIRILPERWEGVYVNWLENIRDWNISRQIWWGHRVPVWYCDDCDEMVVSREDPARCPRCGGALRQDEDVLDTWFSSWLWPFSTLGWPDERAPDLEAFYPTDVLVTAPDILFFWVARMIMAGYEFLDDAPFHTVYLHGMVRDMEHRKMSKSLGNGIDPLDVVALVGADAFRYTIIAGLGMGADVLLDPTDLGASFSPGRHFANKLWNIGRFLLSNIGDDPVPSLDQLTPDRLTRPDRWILGRLDAAIGECDAALGPPRPEAGVWPASERYAGLRLNDYAEAARRFVWNELADWYVETTKARLADDAEDRDVARGVLVYVFDAALRLLHPVVPFITEALWQRLPGREPADLLAVAPWPTVRGGDAAPEFELVREAIVAVRQIRAEYGVPPGRSVDAVLVPSGEDSRVVLTDEAPVVGRLARATVSVAGAAPEGAAAHAVLSDGSHLVVSLVGAIDLTKECARLRGELSQLEQQLAGLRQRLANPRFVDRAPAAVVEGERTKEREWAARHEQLWGKVRSLCGV
jgi:valyl-tRNA synthetase